MPVTQNLFVDHKCTTLKPYQVRFIRNDLPKISDSNIHLFFFFWHSCVSLIRFFVSHSFELIVSQSNGFVHNTLGSKQWKSKRYNVYTINASVVITLTRRTITIYNQHITRINVYICCKNKYSLVKVNKWLTLWKWNAVARNPIEIASSVVTLNELPFANQMNYWKYCLVN